MPSLANRIAVFAFGTIAYLLFVGSFLYAPGFLGNAFVPKSIDSGTAGPLAEALLVNLLLLGAFAVQHSGMARPAFKSWLTRHVPQAAERSLYVLLSSLLIFAFFALWRPMPALIWKVEDSWATAVLHGLFLTGWLLVFYATVLIDHFDLFGMRQVTLYLQGKPYVPHGFKSPSLYRYVRHPLYVGWLIFFWAAAEMTAGRLLFAVGCTAYILVAIRFEERDLIAGLGEKYRRYRASTPMLIPLPVKRPRSSVPSGSPSRALGSGRISVRAVKP